MLLIVSLFVVGYLLIALEHPLRLSKSAVALVLGGLLWTILAALPLTGVKLLSRLTDHVASVAALVFFLMGAMAIVEVIDAHGGFEIITSRITTRSLRTLLWIISFVTFFLSAILDNLTTTIVMLTLCRRLVVSPKDRLFFAGMVVIAANAGGAFSPIGDVTTTMLWLGGQISPVAIITRLLLPSLVNLVLPLAVGSLFVRGGVARQKSAEQSRPVSDGERSAILVLGLGCLIAVPVFKVLTGLPPYLGILLGLGIVWVTTEVLHRDKGEPYRSSLSLAHALVEIDLPSILFFVGILLAVAALEVAGALAGLETWLEAAIGNQTIIVALMGLFSSVIDNVPLVSAAMNMYSLAHFPMDSFLWEFLSYCAGTGGSLLVIGSAAGVTAMGMERLTFGWYARRIAPLALLGYLAGGAVYLLETALR